MKKKLLLLLITAASTLMPNLASAIAIDWGDLTINDCYDCSILMPMIGG
jgi:hypothetical protein